MKTHKGCLYNFVGLMFRFSKLIYFVLQGKHAGTKVFPATVMIFCKFTHKNSCYMFLKTCEKSIDMSLET